MLRKSCLQATALIISLILARAAAVAQPATLVKDINPGAGLQPNYSSHSDLVQSGSFAYFTSDAGGSGNELWRTDGTAAGTRLVADISPAILFGGNAYPSNLTDVNGTLFFTTREQSGPAILWKTDGSTTGTGVVVRLGPNEDLTDLTNVGGTLFFFKYVSGSVDLWKSDGTSVGTVLVRTGLKTPPYGPSFAVLNGILFFAADDGTSGVELSLIHI